MCFFHFFPPLRFITDNSTIFCKLLLVNKVVTLPFLHPNSSRHCPHLKTQICLLSPPILPLFSLLLLHIKYLSARLHLLNARELGKMQKSDQSHLHSISMINGVSLGHQPTDLGTLCFWTGAICHCHPRGRAASWGRGSTSVQWNMSGCVCQRITLTYWVRLYILMSICGLRRALMLKCS